MKKTLILILLLFTTSCVKYNDLNQLSIIKSIGISYDNSYTLYAEVYEEIKKDNEPKTEIIEIHGQTIEEAFNKLKTISNKEIFLSHIDLLILDKDLKDNNYQEIINFTLNNPNLRNDFNCIFSSNIKKLLNNSKYNEIEDFLKTNQDYKRIIHPSFDEVINDFLNNKSIYLSMIIYNKKIEFLGNYQYYNNQIKRRNYEKN